MIDEISVTFTGGSGGIGAISYNLDGRAVLGRPNGGNGGNGGSIWLKKSSNILDLSEFKYRSKVKGHAGTNGGPCGSNGKRGADITILVPLGTEIHHDEKKIQFKESICICKGGTGGIGNGNLVNKFNPMPSYTISPTEPEHKKVTLIQSQIGDIGLIGEPNVGKSSILNALTNSKSKVGNYKFTTINPKIGILKNKKHRYRIIDLPGIIPGANQGKGLGIKFLKHYEKLDTLALVLRADNIESYHFVIQEIGSMEQKINLIIINQADLITKQELNTKINYIKSLTKLPIISLSTIYNNKINHLKQEIIKIITNNSPINNQIITNK